MTLTDQLLCVCDAFCAARSISRARLSTLLLNGGGQLSRIAAGGDLHTSSFERAMRWLSDNWPEGATWPADVARPDRAGSDDAVSADAVTESAAP